MSSNGIVAAIGHMSLQPTFASQQVWSKLAAGWFSQEMLVVYQLEVKRPRHRFGPCALPGFPLIGVGCGLHQAPKPPLALDVGRL